MQRKIDELFGSLKSRLGTIKHAKGFQLFVERLIIMKSPFPRGEKYFHLFDKSSVQNQFISGKLDKTLCRASIDEPRKATNKAEHNRTMNKTTKL